MTPQINYKLVALREQLLGEAHHPASYATRLMDADEAFLKQVSKNLKGALGSRVDLNIFRGNMGVYLEGDGADRSDLSVSFVLSLNLLDAYTIQVNVTGEHVARGKIDAARSFKVGNLTPDEAAGMVLEFF